MVECDNVSAIGFYGSEVSGFSLVSSIQSSTSTNNVVDLLARIGRNATLYDTAPHLVLPLLQVDIRDLHAMLETETHSFMGD
ncbi:hypothetical protein V6N13_113495 [Hibiscus sabdariffa]